MNGKIQKGELITYNLTELIKPEAYEVRLTPVTIFGDGDPTIRVIKYSGKGLGAFGGAFSGGENSSLDQNEMEYLMSCVCKSCAGPLTTRPFRGH